MDDPDAMGAVGKVWVHWVIWNIDPTVTDISEGSSPSGSIEGKTDFGEIGYGGPAPPDKKHTYVFKLYALKTKLDLKKELLNQKDTFLKEADAIRKRVAEDEAEVRKELI